MYVNGHKGTVVRTNTYFQWSCETFDKSLEVGTHPVRVCHYVLQSNEIMPRERRIHIEHRSVPWLWPCLIHDTKCYGLFRIYSLICWWGEVELLSQLGVAASSVSLFPCVPPHETGRVETWVFLGIVFCGCSLKSILAVMVVLFVVVSHLGVMGGEPESSSLGGSWGRSWVSAFTHICLLIFPPHFEHPLFWKCREWRRSCLVFTYVDNCV